jgi:hypothetical protein
MTDLYHRFTGYDELKPLLEGTDEDVLVALRGKPALICIPGTGAERRARLVSCLLHGNEDSGYRAVLDLLRQTPHFPYDLWVFIGNVRAASTDGWFANRYLDDQEDFNRVWGVEDLTTRMRRCAASVLDVLDDVGLEAALDIHNNTGDNPFYAILPQWTPEGLHLAAVCADTLLLWNHRAHTLMEALSPRCPAFALECGQSAIPAHAEYARAALGRFTQADLDGPLRTPRDVFEIRFRVTVRPEVSFAFGGPLGDDLDLVLRPGLDGYNFGMILAGTEIGRVDAGAAMPLCATDMRGSDATDRLLRVQPDGTLVTTEDLTPVMMTRTVQQTRRDCLFYVARRRG